MICGYCEVYQNTPYRYRSYTGEGRNKVSNRQCFKTNKKQTHHSESCQEFNLSKMFWCEKWDQWIHTKVCAARRKNGRCSIRCKQGKVISKLHYEIAPELVLRKIEEPIKLALRPKLLLRRK